MDLFEPSSGSAFDSSELDPAGKPLADRMRPGTFDQFVGQEKLIGPASPLRRAIESDQLHSIILWGPPGSGKTTLAELIARRTKAQFVRFSAVSTGIKEVKELLEKAASYRVLTGRKTVVFIDEIHRFNKAQQDAFLPYVEHGEVILIGATTENPSFEVNAALLSRARVYVLERISEEALVVMLRRAVADRELGLGARQLDVNDDLFRHLAAAADGDGRRALTLLETVATHMGERTVMTAADVQDVHQHGALLYDKSGEEHYNLISALHKSMRGGDPDAALYWLARMLAAGDDPMYLLRRMVRFASEDIGLADPFALTLCLNARDAWHFLGSPEGELAIAQAAIYLACAPKSNAVYKAYNQVRSEIRMSGSLPVPLSIRNAPTSLMKGLGYGKDYQYAHDLPDAMTTEQFLPDQLAGRSFYRPTDRGSERQIGDYLAKFVAYRKAAKES